MDILLLDDHLMTLNGYESFLNPEENNFYKVSNCKDFHEWLCKDLNVDMAIIDHDLPPYFEKNLLNGADCALLLKKLKPNCKLVVITAHDEAMFLYNLNRKVQTDALISKIDFDENLVHDLLNIEPGYPYYSHQIKQAIISINKKTTLLDPLNREILMYLSQGFKTNQLDAFIPLTKSGIQKKISKMLQDFNVKDYQELIQFLKKDHLL